MRRGESCTDREKREVPEFCLQRLFGFPVIDRPGYFGAAWVALFFQHLTIFHFIIWNSDSHQSRNSSCGNCPDRCFLVDSFSLRASLWRGYSMSHRSRPCALSLALKLERRVQCALWHNENPSAFSILDDLVRNVMFKSSQ